MFDWLQDNRSLLYWLTGASILLFAGTLVALPIILVRIPANYFQGHSSAATSGSMTWRIARNVFGCLFIVLGLAMLLLPGQGILMILVGVMLTDFPGKHRLERWIISRKRVLATANWLRHKFGKPSLKISSG